jgi:hypothetical protein
VGEDIHTEALLDASTEADLQVNTKKTKYMFISCHQTTGQNHYTRVTNKSFEKVANLKNFKMAVTNQNLRSQRNHKQIKFKQ